MASGFFDTGTLTNHNHSTVPGDGGVVSNLSVTGTVIATGDVSGVNLHATAGTVDETSTPTTGAQCPRSDQMAVWSLLNGAGV